MARTLDDLAELSGVSRATVSRVINGGPVSEETRRRVLEVIEGTNYRPNLAARSLASGRTGVVGVVMHVDPPVLFEDSYFVALLHGVSDVLADRASGMMLWLGNRSKEETLDRILGTGLMDGVIVSADNLDDPLVDGLLASDLPTVLIGHRRSDLTASYVDIDNVHAADTVTTHLIDIGRTRVGHITGRLGSVAGEDRLTGYRRADEACRPRPRSLGGGGRLHPPFRYRGRSEAARNRVSMPSFALMTPRQAGHWRRSKQRVSWCPRTWRWRGSTISRSPPSSTLP